MISQRSRSTWRPEFGGGDKVAGHLAFRLPRSAVSGGILIPKYYDPDLAAAADLARSAGFELPELGELLIGGEAGSRLGDWIPRELYGTGDVPYVRTSDFSHWRLRPDSKKGVSEAVHQRLRRRQDVAPGDLVLVAHGTYLVGKVAMVCPEDLPLTLQDHVLRLRVDTNSGVDPHLVLAGLSTAFVQRQIRARQFSADIIDKIGERHLGVRVPVPADAAAGKGVADRVRQVIARQSAVKARMRDVSRSDLRMLRERPETRVGFRVRRSDIVDQILIPKFYDPQLENDLAQEEEADSRPWTTLGCLEKAGALSAVTGVEVGKMAYGTGSVPFLRTSDIAEWEVSRNPKQSVSKEVFRAHEAKAALEKNDLLLVRDGTYLVGSSAIVSDGDVPSLFCGGMFRLRVHDLELVAPHALLVLLNLPIVRRQMRVRQFTRDVIDTLGHRLLQVRLPSPSRRYSSDLVQQVEALVIEKAAIKAEIGEIIGEVEPPSPPQSAGRPAWSMR